MRKFTALLGFFLLLPLGAHAENSTRTNGYTIHHNAVTTDVLPPGTASLYQIQRSKRRALVNISVMKDQAGAAGMPVTADVTLKARNLIGQTRDILLREIREGSAIYYIADFPVGDRERLDFSLEVLPEGETRVLQAGFRQEFFVH